MTFTVQDDVGGEAEANAYIDVAAFKAYHDDRGNSYGSASDGDIEKAIVKATDYIDRRFRFVGQRLSAYQSTQWPRLDAFDDDDLLVSGLPQVLKFATAEYALRALSASLAPDPDRDGSGQTVQSRAQAVGPISESVTFAPGAGYTLPAYPLADRLLSSRGLVRSGRTTVRA